MDWDAILSLVLIFALFLFGTVRPVGQQINVRAWFDSHWRGWHALFVIALVVVFDMWIRRFDPNAGDVARWIISPIMAFAVLIAAYRLKEATRRGRKDLARRE